MDTKRKKQINRIIVLVLIIAIVILVTIYVQETPATKGELNKELFKLLAQGLIVGAIGYWIKHLYEESVSIGEKERLRVKTENEEKKKKKEKLEEVFYQLMKVNREIIQQISDTKSKRTSIFICEPSYDELLDIWYFLTNEEIAEKNRTRVK
jgi:hypothetical protein